MNGFFPRTLLLLSIIILVGSSLACQTTTAPGRQVDDAAITTAVKTRLASDVNFATWTNVEVNTTNGIVTLAGQVGNEEERKTAEELALGVEGVRKVNNNLQVAKPPM